jgi:serine/threonine protein kinase
VRDSEDSHPEGQLFLHRDIKPENLFLTADGCLKVLDFGIARFTETELDWSGTADGTVLGTPAFSPPEQARGRLDHIDGRSDLWAVGATLFTLLTGRYVHEAETPNEQLGKAMTAAAPSLGSVLPDLPQALIHVVDRALAYERDERWPTARAMREAIDWVRSSWPELQSTPTRMHPEWVDRASTIEPTTVDAEKPLPAVDGSSHARRRRTTFSLAATVLTIVAVVFGSSRPRATEGAHARPAALHEPSTNAAVSTSTSPGAQPPNPDGFEPPRVPVAMPIVEKPRSIRDTRAATTRRGPMLPKLPQNARSPNGPDELAGAELPRAVFERRH